MASEDDLPTGGAADGAKLMVVAGALGALVLGGWLVHDLLSDGPIDAETEGSLAALPEPSEPQTRAMVSVGHGVGWTWVNPLPRAMPTWYAVDAVEEGARVMIVGLRGTAVRYEGQALRLVETGTAATLRGVAWMGDRSALAVGDDGAIVRIGQGPPTAVPGVEVALRDVVATAPGQALAVGDAGTIVRIGETVSRLASPTDADLLGAFHRDGSVFVVGAGVLLRVVDDAVYEEEAPVSSPLRAVGGCARGPIYAAGDEGVLLRRLVDGTWRRVATHAARSFTGISCDHGRVAAVGAGGRILLISGDETVRLPSDFDRPWQAVSGGRSGRTWVVGTGGRLATIEQSHLQTHSAGPAVPIRALGALGGALVAVGEWGRILRQTRAGFSSAESPTESGLASLIQLGATRLLAVGDFGALVDIRHDRATLLGAPTQASLRDGVGDAQSLLIVGSGGAILRGSTEALSASVIPDAGDVWAVVGSPSRAIAVGEDGLIVRLSPSGFRRIPCDVHTTLRDVARLASGVYAVGDGGTIVRIEDDRCAVERAEGSTLHAIGAGPEGYPIAAGDDGTVIERRAPGAAWTRVGVNVLGASVRSIWRSDRDVYLAGTGGVIVRHILLDGT